MSAFELLALARRLIDLDEETTATRQKMLVLLSNGHDATAPAPEASRPLYRPARTQAGPPRKARSPAQAAAADAELDRLVATLRERPEGIGPAELSRVTAMKPPTVYDRLKRLQALGRAERVEGRGWIATQTNAPQTPAN
jgi:hypothetical protein